MVWYFAFGSNMCIERIGERIGRAVWRKRCLGYLEGFALRFSKLSSIRGVGYANVIPQEGSVVPGIMYDVDEKHLSILDDYEGVPCHYERREISVDIGSRSGDSHKPQLVPAIAYIALDHQTDENLRPTAAYRQYLLNGADLLPADHVEFIRATETHDHAGVGTMEPIVKPTKTSSTSSAVAAAAGGDDTNAPVRSFFVYGSLRPTDDSGQPWTKSFVQGCTHTPARLKGAKMFHDTYASVVLDPVAFADSTVVGDVISFPEDLWNDRFARADQIEGYPDLYDRAVVSVETATGPHRAYVYHRPDAKRDVVVPNGDWLQRDRSL